MENKEWVYMMRNKLDQFTQNISMAIERGRSDSLLFYRKENENNAA